MTDCEANSQQDQADSCGGRRRHRHGGRGRRKERVLHTRVSEQLSQDIRRLADDLRVPVSNLVRNVLEEVFTVVENVSEDVGEFFDDVVEEAEGVRERIRNQQQAVRGARRSTRRRRSGAHDVEDELRRDEAREAGDGKRSAASPPAADRGDEVLGWQPIMLNRATRCKGCGASLEPGANAFMTISSGGSMGDVVCQACCDKT